MNKIKLTLAFFILFATTINSQKYLTKNGFINFFSKAPLEDITADNKQVLSILDEKTGEIAISILMKSFLFEKALMQEHFNENYVESDTYPKATFKGKILDYKSLSANQSVNFVGDITIHGVTKNITIPANVAKNDNEVLVSGDFIVNLDDFKIKVPAVVEKNIAKNIKVTFKFNHSPYKK